MPVIEGLWSIFKEHEGSWISRRVVERLLISVAKTRLANGQFLDFLVERRLLIKAELPIPGGGAAETRRSYQAGREPHFYVANQVVWDAVAAAERLGDLEGLPPWGS